MSEDGADARPGAVPLALFIAIAVFVASDLVADYDEGTSSVHLLSEGVVLLLACLGVFLLWRRFRAARVRVSTLTSDLRAARLDAERWRQENEQLLRGLGAAIQDQFRQWQLSGAEQEVALLLLKGLGHKEIASLRGTSERTAREQARAVYRKAGVSGRSALAAFFLEDLLLPVTAG
jgi:DNA-binding CsgD family transcriptional regulator